ncbi:MAG: zinc-dependent alcohol dehydrogenase [Thermoguttaceae bacterium]
MKAISATAPNKVEIVELQQPHIGPYQVLVRNKVAAICNATDRKLIEGHFPGCDTFPMILGHEGVGVVEKVGEKVRNFQVGDHAIGGLLFEFSDPKYASGWGGFCEYVLVNDHDAMLADGVADAEHGWFECYEIQRKVDKDIPLEEAALLCTWREVYAGFGDFHLKSNDRILVFGAGPVGLSFVKFAKLLRFKWIGVVEPNTERHDKIREMGADEVFTPEQVTELTEKVKSGDFKPLDAVIDAVGNEKIVNASIPLLKLGGSICVYGVLSCESLSVSLKGGPLNFNLFVHQWPTRERERLAQAPLCDWIRAGKLKASEFVTHDFSVEQVEEAFQLGKTGEVIKCLLRF